MDNKKLTQWSIILKTLKGELDEQLNAIFEANEGREEQEQ